MLFLATFIENRKSNLLGLCQLFMKQNLTPTHPFRVLDEILAQQAINLLSLNPHKPVITSFAELGSLITEQNCDIQLINSLRDTLERLLYALLHNFPENIFWDFDFLVNSMFRQALLADDGAVSFLESFGDKVVSLVELCGCQTEIRFRYIHDFIYGFEWAKWVQKEPQNRVHLEPFSLAFLDYLFARGKELLQLISVDDVKYHHLSDTGYRNPFCFSREPEDEYRLLTYLSQKQLIPVAAWNWNAYPVWNQPFQQIREQISLELNIPQTN